ncbi:hypothetical protein [Candidatus Entotheonella palauensis]|uniref:Uncharacterized protein n=1 Tax=Candidatus Entotheonella gemina TaxID=1429439 RepID=W4LQ48_9BACT|nr:hypothetical protein [Candidatus Entotheonella palauensis]ETX00093.1 MAG: hypothetical protein ETSY2_39715 [Candidatus Entotheonella gemina]
MNYYLQIEGVNLANFVYDTNDLSTVRGGSFLLLDAAKIIGDIFKDVLKPISTGASLGLFQFQAAEGDAVRDEVKRILSTHDQLKHATFAVDIQPDTGDYRLDREALRARIRWQQMQQPALAIPAWNDVPTEYCEVDRLRPALTARPGPEKQPERVSTSVQKRSEYGRQYKQNFYQQETGRDHLADIEFAYDFKALTSTRMPAYRKLNHKMAVIYLDGNGFGKMRDKTCTNVDLQRQFDHDMTEYRKAALSALLDIMPQDASWLSDPPYRYRLETLMWGGDEILWVVPAWKGWQTLQLFYAQSQSWTWQGTPLRHAGGMVFCHHNAPIHRIKSLAVQLSDLAKETCREQNLFAYTVLESFDYIGQGLTAALQERYGATDMFVLNAEHMSTIETALPDLKQTFPRRKLHEIVLRLRHEREAAEHELNKVLCELDQTSLDAWYKLQNCFGDNTPALCYNIAELWDYAGL